MLVTRSLLFSYLAATCSMSVSQSRAFSLASRYSLLHSARFSRIPLVRWPVKPVEVKSVEQLAARSMFCSI